MKYIATLVVGFFLFTASAAPAGNAEADQKWLGAVQTMVLEGKTKVTTPSEARANLLKEWATGKGYKVVTTKESNAFVIELRKSEVAVNR